MIGKLLGNRYEILEQLGGGGMAIVYKGRDTLLNRLVTIKILRPEYTCDEDFVKRFRREAQAIASLSHPNIVSIYDVGQEGQVHYLVMEYVEGDNLKNLIRGQGALPQERVVEFARQISEALQHAHDNNIVHRDVKPQNILITREGRAKLTDFGIAREATAATLTQSDMVVGSVHYLSPEQARGETAGPQSDIYSMGIVMYEMATGVLPFHGDTPIGVALKHIQEMPPRPASLNPAVPAGLERVIGRAMAKIPVDRYTTATEMVAELESVARQTPAELRKPASVDEFATMVLPIVKSSDNILISPARERRTGRHVPGWLWAALVVLVLLGAGASAFWFYINVPEIVMPSLEGKTQEEAQDTLKDLGIKNVQVSRSAHPTVLQGRVVSQDPPPETKIKVSRNVTITVSQGPEIRTVPDVIKLLLNDARIKISQSELIVVEPVQESFSSDVQPGVIIDADPKPGTKLSKGSGVVLYVSKGQQPVAHQAPDLLGLTVDKARAELDKLKLKLDANISRSTSSEYLSGQIIAQRPVKGTEVQEGSAVQVTVSSGPGPTKRLAKVDATMPDDKKDHELRIVVKDITGSTDAYINTHKSGEKVVKEVPYYGKALVQVYIDKNKIGEQTFE